MKTLIYGAGPIGRWLSVKLAKAGLDVTLLARGGTYDALAENGVSYVDSITDQRLAAQVTLTRALRPDDRYELVVVPMVKQSRLAVCPILAQNRNIEHILLLGNDVAGPEEYLQHLPREKLLRGFPGAGGGWDDGELIMADRDRPRGRSKLFLGELDGKTRPRTRRIMGLFVEAGLAVSLESDVDGWLKYHFAFIAPTAGAIFKHGGDLQAVARDPETIHQYCAACREAGDVLARIGYKRRQPFVFNLYYWLPRWLEPPVFAKLFGAEETAVRFGLHAKVVGPELKELAEEFAMLRTEAGLETPHLDALLEFVPAASS